MNFIAIRALIRNDLRLYLTDRRAVIVGILIPICIAAFFGYVFNDAGKGRDAGKLPVAVVDEDQGAISSAIVADISKDDMLAVVTLPRDAAREQVRKGKLNAAAILPAGFGEKSVSAMFNGEDKPKIELLVDPSQQMTGRLVEGLIAQYAMKHVSREAFNGSGAGVGSKVTDGYLKRLEELESTPEREQLKSVMHSVRRLRELRDGAGAQGGAGFELDIPYELVSTPVTSGNNVPYNGYAHSFGGMSVQFILMAGIDAGIMLLLMRQRGIWQRMRSAPLRKSEFILARMLATALISAFQLVMIYVAACLIFGVRIQGSWAGFVLVAGSFCLLNAAFGLMLATLGKSAAATRGISIMVMLLMVMLGGAWVPTFIFPAWLQQVSLYTPTHWAVAGLDAMTWRGLPFADALLPAAVLAGSALVFMAIAVRRFRWEE